MLQFIVVYLNPKQTTMTNLLKASEVTKGIKIFKVTIWNFHRNCIRKDNFYRDKNGKCVYTPHTIDQYNVSQWEVYSCGKKQMYLCNANKMKGERFYIENDNFLNYFTSTKEQAIALVEELRANDKYSMENYEILNEQY